MDSVGYYDQHGREYYEETVDLSMEEHLERFISYLPENAEILDLGCGSGRDTVYLTEAGFYVTPMDGSATMCSLAEIHADMEVLHMNYEEMEFEEVFDGIWASASLLHVPKKDIDKILDKISNALVPGGILYMSFQYGEGEEIRNQRFYNDYQEKSMKALLRKHREFELLEMYESEDIRPGRSGWLNVMVRKEGSEEF